MFTEDLPSFFRDFGTDVPVYRAASLLRTIRSIFNAPAQEVAIYDRSLYDEKFYSAKVAVNNPHLLSRTVDASGLRLNDKCVVDGVDYFITYMEADGTGLSLIHLSFDQV